jgi:hypothetical protein
MQGCREFCGARGRRRAGRRAAAAVLACVRTGVTRVKSYLSTYHRNVDNNANFHPTKTHLNSFLFIFPPAYALENVFNIF